MKLIDKVRKGNLLESILDNLEEKVKYNNNCIRRYHRQTISFKRRMQYYKKLKKQIFDPIIRDFKVDESLKPKQNNTIWFCWLQGIENAPETVKECYNSIKRWLVDKRGYKIVVVDENNMSNYVKFPKHILEKYKKGIITKTHLSDLLRVELLYNYGGLWIDSTVFLTGDRFIDYLTDVNFFAPSKWTFFDANIISYESWFIYSTSNCFILDVLRKCLYLYWEKYSFLIDYFLFHIFLSIITDYFKDELDIKNMPYVGVDGCELLAQVFDPTLSINKLKSILNQSDIHKLNNKIKFDWDELKNKFNFLFV